jgi:hypothetical protein
METLTKFEGFEIASISFQHCDSLSNSKKLGKVLEEWIIKYIDKKPTLVITNKGGECNSIEVTLENGFKSDYEFLQKRVRDKSPANKIHIDGMSVMNLK